METEQRGRMTEGKLYLCSWTRIPGGYRVWLKADPTIAAEDADFEAADEMVTGSLCWTSTLTVTSWSRSVFIRPMTDCPSRRSLSSSR